MSKQNALIGQMERLQFLGEMIGSSSQPARKELREEAERVKLQILEVVGTWEAEAYEYGAEDAAAVEAQHQEALETARDDAFDRGYEAGLNRVSNALRGIQL